MNHTPEKSKTGKTISFLCMLISCIALIFVTTLDVRYRLFYQMVALSLYVFSLQILYRYYLTTFSYAVDAENFIITKRTGKKVQTVCNLSLSTLIDITQTPKTRDARKAFAARYGRRKYRYNYCQSMSPERKYSVLFEFNGDTAEIVFEPSLEMVQLLATISYKRKDTENISG